MKTSKLNSLRLIESPRKQTFEAGIAPLLGHQTPLFPTFYKNILVFVNLPRAGAREFLHAFEVLKPNFVIELRKFPRFDFEFLTRELAFAYFDHYKVKYVDFASQQSLPCFPGPQSTSWNLGISSVMLNGPIMVLIDHQLELCGTVEFVTEQMRNRSGVDWNVLEVPGFLKSE